MTANPLAWVIRVILVIAVVIWFLLNFIDDRYQQKQMRHVVENGGER